jgi:hypothetical protein
MTSSTVKHAPLAVSVVIKEGSVEVKEAFLAKPRLQTSS